jgi:hypothetical protein
VSHEHETVVAVTTRCPDGFADQRTADTAPLPVRGDRHGPQGSERARTRGILDHDAAQEQVTDDRAVHRCDEGNAPGRVPQPGDDRGFHRALERLFVDLGNRRMVPWRFRTNDR